MAVFHFYQHRFSGSSGWFLFFHPTKTGNFPAASAGWFLILPHAAHIFSAEAVFGISDSISLLVRFCRRKQQKPAMRPLPHRRYPTIDFSDCSARECARSPAGSA